MARTEKTVESSEGSREVVARTEKLVENPEGSREELLQELKR